MSTASIMSGLLNASGLKERLSEYGGKANLPLADFPPIGNRKAGDSAPEGRFLAQFEGLAGNGIGNGAEDGADNLDAVASAESSPEQESRVENGPPVEGEVSILVDGEAADIPAAMEQGLPADDNAVPPAAVTAAGASSYPQMQAKTDSRAAPTGNDAPEQVVARGGGDATVGRAGTGMAAQSTHAWGGYGTSEIFDRPGRTGEGATPPGLNGRAAPASGNAPLVTVAGFSMTSAKSDYPSNFTEKFSRQLDMMRPTFRAFASSDGLARAAEAGGQTVLLAPGPAAGGTLPQVQQAIQTSLVNLAREGTGGNPTVKTMELSLVPRSLGEIKVHMMHAGNRISVEIVTSTVAATQAMETVKNDIVKAYLQFGIQPEEVNIRVTETRDATQPTLQASSEQDRFAQGGGQGLARHGAGSSMAERQEAARQQETGAGNAAGSEGPKPVETAKPARSDVMGKVQYF